MAEQTQQQTPRGGTQTDREPGGVAIVDIWTFEVEPVVVGETGTGDTDISGFTVEARDGKIGKVDHVSYETGGSLLVVDTGPWIFGKKVLLPAGVVEQVDPDSKTVFVDRTKDEIKNAPEYDEQAGHDDREYRGRLGDYYGNR